MDKEYYALMEEISRKIEYNYQKELEVLKRDIMKTMNGINSADAVVITIEDAREIESELEKINQKYHILEGNDEEKKKIMMKLVHENGKISRYELRPIFMRAFEDQS